MSIKKEKFSTFEIVNLNKQESGLPYDVWLDSIGSRRNEQHNNPRINVDVNGDRIPVSISDNDVRIKKPFRDSNVIKNWVVDNYDTLIKHWNGELTDRQALTLLYKG
jgi:hypothetical protein